MPDFASNGPSDVMSAAPVASTRGAQSFRDPTLLTRWVTGLLTASLLFDVVALVSGLLEYRLLAAISEGMVDGDIDALAAANDRRQQLIGFGEIGLFLATGILFLMWVYRANANARALGAAGMRFTPGWAVGWYFVPIASLWKPFQSMREIWQASAMPGNWQAAPTTPLLGWWWALYLCNAIVGQIGYRLSQSIDGLDSAMTASTVTTSSCVLDFALNAVSIALLAKAAANQRWQAKARRAS